MGAFLDALQSTGETASAPTDMAPKASPEAGGSEYAQPELIQQLDAHLSSLASAARVYCSIFNTRVCNSSWNPIRGRYS
jgi:hypothetical protein